MRYYPNHYDTILEQSLAALEATLRSNEATLETRMIKARLKSALVRVMTERTQVRRGDKGLGANKRDGANGFVETVDAARRSVLPGGLHVGRRYSRRASSCGASASGGADRRQSAMPWQATLGCAGGGACAAEVDRRDAAAGRPRPTLCSTQRQGRSGRRPGNANASAEAGASSAGAGRRRLRAPSPTRGLFHRAVRRSQARDGNGMWRCPRVRLSPHRALAAGGGGTEGGAWHW